MVPQQSITLTADKTVAVATLQDKVTLTATVKDSTGSPVAGQALTFKVSAGVSPYGVVPTTDRDGSIRLVLKHPPVGPNRTAVVTVSAASGAITSNEVTLTFSNPPQTPAAVTLTADKVSLTVDGTDNVTLTTTATDAAGLPVAGQAVQLDIPAGPYLIAGVPFTSNSGQLSTFICSRVTSPALTGPVTIPVTASVNGVQSNTITLTLSPP